MEDADQGDPQDHPIASRASPSDTSRGRARWYRPASLNAQKSRHQITIATALLTAIPFLSITFLTLVNFSDYHYSTGTQAAVAVFGIVLGMAGYLILRQYPRNLERLNESLHQLSTGVLPERVNLIKSAEDIGDIEHYLNIVIQEMRNKIACLESELERSETLRRIIAQQNDDLVEAERVRVMVETLGAACHHIGQPATVLQMNISLLHSQLTSEHHQAMLTDCLNASEQIGDVLKKLRRLSTYRTVPYRIAQDLQQGQSRILDIDSAAQATAAL